VSTPLFGSADKVLKKIRVRWLISRWASTRLEEVTMTLYLEKQIVPFRLE